MNICYFRRFRMLFAGCLALSVGGFVSTEAAADPTTIEFTGVPQEGVLRDRTVKLNCLYDTEAVDLAKQEVRAKCTLKLFEPGARNSQFTLTLSPQLKMMANSRLFVGNLNFPNSGDTQVSTFSLYVYLKQPASLAPPTGLMTENTHGACFNLNGVSV